MKGLLLFLKLVENGFYINNQFDLVNNFENSSWKKNYNCTIMFTHSE